MYAPFAYCIVIATLLTVAAPVGQAQDDDRRTITMTGSAEARIDPDQVIVRVGVVTEGRTVQAAKELNDTRSRAVLTLLANNGVPARDIQTSNLSIEPVYDYSSKSRKLLHYQMANTVTVTVRKLTSLEKILDDVLTDGANVLDNIQFVVSNQRAISDSLRIEATRNAKTKAAAVAEALGMRLGKPIVVSTEQSESFQPMVRYTLSSRASDSSTPISAGQETITSTISITFELE